MATKKTQDEEVPVSETAAANREPDRTKSPFVVKGIDPASGANPDADDRLAWLEKQQDAMHEAQR